MLVVVTVEIWLWLPVYRSKTVAWGACFYRTGCPCRLSDLQLPADTIYFQNIGFAWQKPHVSMAFCTRLALYL